MKKNMGLGDRLIRLAIAGLLAALFLGEIITGTIGIIALVVSVIFILTSLVSFCPLYTLFGLSTCKR